MSLLLISTQPKPTSPGHDYGRCSQTATPAAPGSPCEPVTMSSWLQQQPPLIFMRMLRLQSMTLTLSYTAKYNSSPIVTRLYKYSTQDLTLSLFQSSFVAIMCGCNKPGVSYIFAFVGKTHVTLSMPNVVPGTTASVNLVILTPCFFAIAIVYYLLKINMLMWIPCMLLMFQCKDYTKLTFTQ
jgi:hypothetical protein